MDSVTGLGTSIDLFRERAIERGRARVAELREKARIYDEEQSASRASAIFPAKTGESAGIAGLKAVGNTPSSAFNLAKNLYEAVRHPITTTKAVGALTRGAGEKIARTALEHTSLRDKVKEMDPDTDEQMFDAVVSGLKERYGSLEAAQRTATNDPFAFGADVMAVISGGAGLARKAGLGGAVDAVTDVTKVASRPLGELNTAARQGAASVLERSAQRGMEKVLAPTKETMKIKSKQVLPELTARRKVAFSRKGLSEQVEGELRMSGEAIDEAWQKLPEGTREKVTPILDALEESKSNFVVEGTIIEPTAFKAADDLQKIILDVSKGEDTISSESLRRVRQIWDESIDRSKGFTKDLSEQDKLSIKREATDAIRRVLSDAHPEIATLNAEYSFWKKVDDVLSETIKRKTGQDEIGVNVRAMGIGGGIGGSNLGLKEAAIGAGLFGGLALAMRSTLWKTVSAATKMKLAEAIVAGNKVEVARILTPIIGDQAAGLIIDANEEVLE